MIHWQRLLKIVTLNEGGETIIGKKRKISGQIYWIISEITQSPSLCNVWLYIYKYMSSICNRMTKRSICIYSTSGA